MDGSPSGSLVYEYTNFPPIPFQAGDILGAFIPRGGLNKHLDQKVVMVI